MFIFSLRQVWKWVDDINVFHGLMRTLCQCKYICFDFNALQIRLNMTRRFRTATHNYTTYQYLLKKPINLFCRFWVNRLGPYSRSNQCVSLSRLSKTKDLRYIFLFFNLTALSELHHQIHKKFYNCKRSVPPDPDIYVNNLRVPRKSKVTHLGHDFKWWYILI